MDTESLVYIAITGLVALMLIMTSAGYGPFALVIAVLAAIAILVNIMINYVDFIVFPFVTRLLGISFVVGNRYTIPKTQDSVIKYVNGIYYATGYLTGNLYNYVFSSQQEQDDRTAFAGAMDKWERIVMNVDFPFKFNVIAMSENVQKYREELDGQRGYIEFQISREMNSTNPNQMSIGELERRLGIIQAKMDRVATGERPMNVMMYIESTAVGVSEKEASDRLANQLSQLQTVFNAFDLSIMRVTGREVYFLNRLNYMIPNWAELNKMFQSQK
ncbi:MAG: hypothetical protein M1354_02905 [Candidatus Marsarchaeota archaeon]|jgi:hypothetical protein|nr:hypothetical protein [Candidatus Marsarchaeota archaeon]